MQVASSCWLGYQGHYLVDEGRARIILGALATPGEVPEERPALDLLWQARCRPRLRPRQATGDKAYGTLEIVRALEEQGVRAYLLLPDREHAAPFFGKGAFRYDSATDAYTCPGGATLPCVRPDRPDQLLLYQAPAATCNASRYHWQAPQCGHGRGNVPVVNERPQYEGTANLGLARSGSVVFGRNGGALTWSFPDGSTANGDQTQMYLFNPGLNANQVQATFYSRSGAPVNQTYTILGWCLRAPAARYLSPKWGPSTPHFSTPRVYRVWHNRFQLGRGRSL